LDRNDINGYGGIGLHEALDLVISGSAGSAGEAVFQNNDVGQCKEFLYVLGAVELAD
jgi:hypothetical protein